MALKNRTIKMTKCFIKEILINTKTKFKIKIISLQLELMKSTINKITTLIYVKMDLRCRLK
jgi:hypothetical protein